MAGVHERCSRWTYPNGQLKALQGDETLLVGETDDGTGCVKGNIVGLTPSITSNDPETTGWGNASMAHMNVINQPLGITVINVIKQDEDAMP